MKSTIFIPITVSLCFIVVSIVIPVILSHRGHSLDVRGDMQFQMAEDTNRDIVSAIERLGSSIAHWRVFN